MSKLAYLESVLLNLEVGQDLGRGVYPLTSDFRVTVETLSTSEERCRTGPEGHDSVDQELA